MKLHVTILSADVVFRYQIHNPCGPPAYTTMFGLSICRKPHSHNDDSRSDSSVLHNVGMLIGFASQPWFCIQTLHTPEAHDQVLTKV